MKLICHNCQSTSTNYNNSASIPKCPNCRSQAPQPRMQREERQRNIRQNPFDMFQQMQRMMNRNMRNDIFGRMREMRGMDMSQMFPTMMMGRNRMINTLQMPQFQQERQERINSGPVFYRQIIRQPNGETFIYSNMQGDNEVDQNQQQLWEPHQHLQMPQQKKPKVSDFTHISKLTQQCSICTHKDGQGICLPCNHKFHKECLIPWFQVKDTCPCCRLKL